MERVEVPILAGGWPGAGCFNATQGYETFTPNRGYGWKFYAERPVPPKPDLVERLRQYVRDCKGCLPHVSTELAKEAAAEIERLRGRA